MSTNYFTNFGFAGYDLPEFHCTHAYLGELTSEDVPRIVRLLDGFFADQTARRFPVCFDQPKTLGTRRVLVAASSEFPPRYSLLFDRINDLTPSKFGFYPHVTLKEADFRREFAGLIDRYVLVEKKNRDITVLYARRFAR